MSSWPVKTVLYAEDDENDVFFMERAFSKLKLRPALHVVPDGGAAVDYLSGGGAYSDRARHPLPDLVLLDVKMPQLSGLEVLAWARGRPEYQSLPILLFTSSTQHADVEFSRLHRANGYFVKPSNSEQLSALLCRILDACAGFTAGEVLAVEENQFLAG